MNRGLLGKKATGGATARKGFEYQDAFALQHLPMWLAEEAFSHLVSESIGDLEVCYFALGGGTKRHAFEAKDHPVTDEEFWHEVREFKRMHEGSPTEFFRFTLVCRDFKRAQAPLIAELERLRGPGLSFNQGSPVIAAAAAEIEARIAAMGQGKELASFLIERVYFERFTSSAAENAFFGLFLQHLPAAASDTRQVAAIRDSFKELIGSSSKHHVSRRDLESAIVENLGVGRVSWMCVPTRLTVEPAPLKYFQLGVSLEKFVEEQRKTLSSTDWEELSQSIAGVREQINSSRERTSISLIANQRISISCLLGATFSAARGFQLEIAHRDMIFHTRNQVRSATSFFHAAVVTTDEQESEGIVCIGFPTPVSKDYELVPMHSAERLPRLELVSDLAIESEEALNQAVYEAKGAIYKFRSEYHLHRLHMLIKAPSFFAMAFGHRINGLGPVQLYDWVGGSYIPTVLLHC